MFKYYVILFIFFFCVILFPLEVATIELEWTPYDDYEDFLIRNISEKGRFSFVPTRNVIIVYDTQERIDFIEEHIKINDISEKQETVVNEIYPVKLDIKVRDYESLSIDKELESGRSWEFENKHPVIFREQEEGEPVYNIEMVGIKAIVYIKRITSERVSVRLDIYYDYVMGWNNFEQPVIDCTEKTLESVIFKGNSESFEKLDFGNRIIDCEISIGYNMLSR
ncbi:MAG: hypothetical protein ACQESP_01240 [Candidatus Muiribacteriota bacterium]